LNRTLFYNQEGGNIKVYPFLIVYYKNEGAEGIVETSITSKNNMIKNVFMVKNLTKKFPGVVAVNNINLEIGQNEIYAIIGENGAGKSTFCKLLTGVYQADEGEMYLFGEKVNIKSPADAISKGINMVYQERNLINSLNGAQNIYLGKEPMENNRLFLDEKKIYEKACELRENLEVDVPLDVPLRDLKAGHQQMIEIIRSFSNDNSKLLILDEPTSSLGVREVEPFLNFIQKIKKEMNISIIFISHKLEEVFNVADKISVFADGQKVLTEDKTKLTRERCIKAMLRKDLLESVKVKHNEHIKSKIILKVGKCNYDGKEHNLNFHIREREVVGFYGLVGSGRTECVEAIYGLRPCKNVDIVLNDKKINKSIPVKMINEGVILIPEERINAIFSNYSLIKNISISFLKKFSLGLLEFIKVKKEREFSKYVLEKNNIIYSNIDQEIHGLSGGNQQKVIIGRSLEIEEIKLLFMDEPTKGLDLGIKNDVYKMMRDLVEKHNKSIVFISSELPELISICDRMYIFSKGNVVKHFERNEFEKAAILKAVFMKGVINERK